MSTFNLNDTLVAAAVRPVMPTAGVDVDADAMAERFARAVWTGIAEPGDGDAGALIEAIGATAALSALMSPSPRTALRAALPALDDPHAERELASSIDTALTRWLPRMSSVASLHALEVAALVGARLLIPGDSEWPVGVDDLGANAPIALWVRGNRDALTSLGRSIALVGARAATAYGEHVTHESSAALVGRGFSIVSGAAYGIDGAAHRAALASDGITVAFLAGGVDRFYPQGHHDLLTRITLTGAVVAEMPCGTAPTRWRFLQRNRLIAASSRATVVLEAGWRSGSLNTGGHAADLGHPLGAVPGPVTSPASRGCHRLIRDYGAVCVTDAAQMAELVTGLDPTDADTPFDLFRPSGDEVRVVDALSTRSPRTLEDITRRCGLAPTAVQGALGALEITGAVISDERGWRIVPRR